MAEHEAAMRRSNLERGPLTMVGWTAAKLFESALGNIAGPPVRGEHPRGFVAV